MSMEDSKKEKSELQSFVFENPHLREVLGKEPAWIIRYGLILILLIVILVLTGSYVFKYPEIIETRITITTQSPPISIVSETAGRIEKLFIKENQNINKGDTILLIENPTNFSDLEAVWKNFVPFYETMFNQGIVSELRLDSKIDLGELQPHYNNLLTTNNEYWSHITNNVYKINVQNLEQEISQLNALLRKKGSLLSLIEEDYKITEQQHKVNKQLLDTKTIANLDFDISQKEFLSQQQRKVNGDIDLINTEIQLQSKVQELSKTREEFLLKKENLFLDLKKSSLTLRSEINRWQKRYLKLSPITGRITFVNYWAENQNIMPNEEIFVIIPDDYELFGYSDVELTGYGKVKKGQKVLIRMDAFPYQEFGVLNGQVMEMASISRENKYRIKVAVPDNLKTNYGHIITFTQEMKGNAQIVTDDLRLIERLFNQLRSMYQN